MDNSVKAIDINDWVTVKTAGGGYLGKISGAAASKLAGSTNGDRVKAFKEKVFRMLKDNNGWLELSPVFDYSAPLIPMQDPRTQRRSFSREPVIVPTDFTTSESVVSVMPTSILFLGDLQDGDRKTYGAFIAQAEDLMMRLRAQQSGIVPPDGGVIGHG